MHKSSIAFRFRQVEHRLHYGQHVTCSMVDLAGKELLAVLGLLPVGDINRDAADAYHMV